MASCAYVINLCSSDEVQTALNKATADDKLPPKEKHVLTLVRLAGEGDAAAQCTEMREKHGVLRSLVDESQRRIPRAAIKSFVVEWGTPGMELARLEKKLGIRASDTAAITFNDCRVPKENLLGNPEVDTKGFGGVMETFDNTRPLVACFALGLVSALNESCAASTGIALLMGVGFFGSLSTFSTFAVELLNELRAGQVLTAFVLAVASIGAGLFACAVGYGLGTHG